MWLTRLFALPISLQHAAAEPGGSTPASVRRTVAGRVLHTGWQQVCLWGALLCCRVRVVMQRNREMTTPGLHILTADSAVRAAAGAAAVAELTGGLRVVVGPVGMFYWLWLLPAQCCQRVSCGQKVCELPECVLVGVGDGHGGRGATGKYSWGRRLQGIGRSLCFCVGSRPGKARLAAVCSHRASNVPKTCSIILQSRHQHVCPHTLGSRSCPKPMIVCDPHSWPK